MSFRENLQHLRRTRHMTQEQLAMLVGVSRQSVTKWEAERAYPEMDKLMKLCDIFGCTLDELVQGDLTDTEATPAEQVDGGPATDVCGYDAHMHRFARGIALGVALIVLGTALAVLTEALLGPSSPLPAIPIFLGVLSGLYLIIPVALEHGEFKRAHPYIEDFYTAADRQAGGALFARLLVIGIGVIFLGVIVAVILSDGGGAARLPWAADQIFPGSASDRENLSGVAVLTCTSLGAGILIYAGILQSRFNLKGYNDETESDDGDGLEPTGDNKRLADAVSSVIMLSATIVGLLLLFLGRGTVAGSYFWLSWPIGGLLCAIANILFAIRPQMK